MKPLLTLISVLFAAHSFAQDSSTIFIPAGQSFSSVVGTDKLYLFPQFKNGKVYFRDGSITPARLNYNFLNGELEFIKETDTLAMIKGQALNIKNVVIDSSRFYYYVDGYLQEISSNAKGKILKRQQLKVKKREKIGAYDQPSSTTAIESYSTFVSGDGALPQSLTVRENITLAKRTELFIGDQYGTFLPANKKNFLRLFTKSKDRIDKYLKNNKVDFTSAEDLQKLLSIL